MNKLTLLLALAATSQAATLYTDGTFLDSNWQTIVLQQQGPSSLPTTQSATNGNPGDSVRAAFSIPFQTAGQVSNTNIVRYRNDFAWNPATDGALSTINFQMDVRNLTSTGFSSLTSLFWRPILVQNGLTFSVLSSSLAVTPLGNYQTLSWNFTNASSWANFENANLAPNFSTSGGTITFGYRVQFGGSCSAASTAGCNAVSVIDAMDNYQVQLAAAQSTSGIPEPSTWALGLAGLTLITLRRRQRAN